MSFLGHCEGGEEKAEGRGKEKWVRASSGREDGLLPVSTTSAGPAPGSDISRQLGTDLCSATGLVQCGQQLGWNHRSHQQLYSELAGLGSWRDIFIWLMKYFLKGHPCQHCLKVLSAPLARNTLLGVGEGWWMWPLGFSHGLALCLGQQRSSV